MANKFINTWEKDGEGCCYLYTNQEDICVMAIEGNSGKDWYIDLDYLDADGCRRTKEYKRAYKSQEAAKKAATKILITFYEKLLKERNKNAAIELEELKKL
jgi:hypothetical protein